MKVDIPFRVSNLSLTAFFFIVIDSRKRRGKGDISSQSEDQSNTASTSLFEEKTQPKLKAQPRAPRLTHAQLRELEAQKEKEVTRGYQRVQELWSRMLAGEPEAEREWSTEAEKLVETFRETRNLFLTSRVSHFVRCSEDLCDVYAYQTHPFRGMFPRRRGKQQVEIEADEDRMASRLQLDLGEHQLVTSWKYYAHTE